MDPDANLREQLKLAKWMQSIVNGKQSYTKTEFEVNAVRLAELVQALDGWISKGGFLPTTWAKVDK
jgi:hypothetical protein